MFFSKYGLLMLLLAVLGGRVLAGEMDIFRTVKIPVKGIVAAVHGLNVAPSKMGDAKSEGTIVKALLDDGYTVVRVTLTGHTGTVDTMKSVTAAAWLNDAYTCYLAARAEAERVEKLTSIRCPVYLAGFSLGALVFEVLMNEKTETPVCFDKAALFAPAIAVKDFAHGVTLLAAAEGGRTIVKSMSPAEYRAQGGASISAYKALFSLEKRLKTQFFANNNIPTLVFISPNDEFISRNGLKKLIKKFSLTNWTLKNVSNAGAIIRPVYKHLIIDDKCLGKEMWEDVRRAMLDFLTNGATAA